MQFEHRSTKALVVVIGALLALVVLAGTFFVGMRIGVYRTERAITAVVKTGNLDALPSAPAGFQQFLKKSGFSVQGEVTAIAGDRLTVLNAQGGEHVFLLTTATKVRSGGKLADRSLLQVGDQVMGIGAPLASGELQVRVLRVLKAPKAKR